jgi:hypothetical protein
MVGLLQDANTAQAEQRAMGLRLPRRDGFTLSGAARCEAPSTTCRLKGQKLAPASARGRCYRIPQRGVLICY